MSGVLLRLNFLGVRSLPPQLSRDVSIFALFPSGGGVRSCRHKSTVELPYKKLTSVSDAGIAQLGKGKIYDKKPFKFSLVQGKKYAWCCCGWSKSQPFCDGTHANPHMRLKLGPVVFIAPETGDYWLCNCKQTSQRPFCDGTHRNEEIQAAIRS